MLHVTSVRLVRIQHEFEPGLEKTRFLRIRFRFFKGFIRSLNFLDFSVQIRLDTKFRPRKNILYTILSVTSFSVNYNKTHKSGLKHEIKYDLYKTKKT